MKILVESGIITVRKIGKWSYYSICENSKKKASDLIEQMLTLDTFEYYGLLDPSIKYKLKDSKSMKSFSIMVDTSSDIPSQYLKEQEIETLPITFELDGNPHNKGYWQDISGKDFYDALRNGALAKTAQINPDTFLDIFTEYAKNNKDLVILLLSGALSATYQSALIALKDVKEEYPDCNIYPVDSISASCGIWLLVDLIVKKRDEGLSAKDVVNWLEQKKHSCLGLFTVDDLMYLHRGGRLSKMQALAGSVLKVKPVLNLAPDGSLALKGKTRGRKASLELLTQQIKRSINTDTKMETIYIAHTDCQADAEAFAELIYKAIDVKKIEIILMGPVIGAHVGPGALVVLYEADMTRNEYESEFYSK
jgi:DegV family protein with EDD domain